MKNVVNHETGSTKDAKAKRMTGDQTHEEVAVKNEKSDGHTKDRTNILPWDSCGPDCQVCAEFEK